MDLILNCTQQKGGLVNSKDVNRKYLKWRTERKLTGEENQDRWEEQLRLNWKIGQNLFSLLEQEDENDIEKKME